MTDNFKNHIKICITITEYEIVMINEIITILSHSNWSCEFGFGLVVGFVHCVFGCVSVFVCLLSILCLVVWFLGFVCSFSSWLLGFDIWTVWFSYFYCSMCVLLFCDCEWKLTLPGCWFLISLLSNKRIGSVYYLVKCCRRVVVKSAPTIVVL